MLQEISLRDQLKDKTPINYRALLEDITDEKATIDTYSQHD